MANYVTGSGLEVPGLEAVLEYGDSSKIAADAIPGAMRINDRSVLEQVRCSSITGLHDDPDGRDTRQSRSDQHGEDAGLMFYGGRTIGLTGEARAGSIPAMRDVWRRFRSQFGTAERDLLIHPLGEVKSYTNSLPNPRFSKDVQDWTYESSGGTTSGITATTDGDLTVGQIAMTSLPSGQFFGAVSGELGAVAWDGQDVLAYGQIRSPGALAPASVTVSVIQLDESLSTLATTQVGTTSPGVTGNWAWIGGVLSADSVADKTR